MAIASHVVEFTEIENIICGYIVESLANSKYFLLMPCCCTLIILVSSTGIIELIHQSWACLCNYSAPYIIRLSTCRCRTSRCMLWNDGQQSPTYIRGRSSLQTTQNSADENLRPGPKGPTSTKRVQH